VGLRLHNRNIKRSPYFFKMLFLDGFLAPFVASVLLRVPSSLVLHTVNGISVLHMILGNISRSADRHRSFAVGKEFRVDYHSGGWLFRQM
jgi:hypothetical protein